MNYNADAFYVSRILYKLGDIIQPGNWGNTITAIGPAHARYAVEMAFEVERQQNFPTKPSRLTSNFIWADQNDAEWYRTHHHPTDRIYKVEFDQNVLWHQGIFLCVPPVRGMTESEAIRHYWAFDYRVYWDADPTYMPSEIVTTSPIRILQEIVPTLSSQTGTARS